MTEPNEGAKTIQTDTGSQQDIKRDDWLKRLGNGTARVARDTGLVLLGVGAYAADGLKELRRLPELMQDTGRWTADAAGRVNSQLIKAYHKTTDRGATAYESIVESRGSSDQGQPSSSPTGTDAAASYEDWTKDELYERAQELDIQGRSGMNKSELVDAIRDH